MMVSYAQDAEDVMLQGGALPAGSTGASNSRRRRK